MNKLLKLQGHLLSQSRKGAAIKASFPGTIQYLNTDKIDSLISYANGVMEYWLTHNNYIDNCLVTVRYIDVVPKSRRMTQFLWYDSKPKMVGAKFGEFNGKLVHLITYLTSIEGIQKTIDDLESLKNFINDNYDGIIDKNTLEYLQSIGCTIPNKTNIVKKIMDAVNIDSFIVQKFEDFDDLHETNLVSFYDTGADLNVIFNKLNIKSCERFYGENVLGNLNYLLTKEEVIKLAKEVGYLISMHCPDLAKLVSDSSNEDVDDETMYIEEPTTEPIIGVIDTLFDDKCYFSKWVDYKCLINPDIPDYNDMESKIHGTEVDSIIVDGHRLNPELDDGCGRFRVRHFGVATKGYISRIEIMRQIRNIVTDKENKDIHVWNICLGSEFEISKNFISPEGALLDELQSKNPNIIFVVAGTNDKNAITYDRAFKMKIGAPADSLNSVVVNSINFNTKRSSIYSRYGEVLSFFIKPDLCYYGGDFDSKIIAHNGCKKQKVCGTSFAAPFIARKLCYLIDVLGMNRETAKAILIDSAASWRQNDTIENMELKGYGCVPISIRNIVEANTNEIKFFIQGNVDKYETLTYNIPVPAESLNATMYIARAVLCYLPHCDREQGVDYTKTELSLSFGRVNEKRETGVIGVDSIGNNTQELQGSYVNEEEARKLFRKWDNVKRVCESIPVNAPRTRKCLNGKWGFSIKIKERENDHCDRGMPFGLVITLYEKNMKNKQDEFVRNCYANGWLVEEIDIDNKLNVYSVMQEEVSFDD